VLCKCSELEFFFGNTFRLDSLWFQQVRCCLPVAITFEFNITDPCQSEFPL
jgi:hypothetical protein